MRPDSIDKFGKVYLGAIVIGIVNTILSWSQMNAILDQSGAAAAGMGTGTIVFATIVGILIPILLWYFIVRRASNVAKWIYVVLTALGVFGFLAGLVNPLAPKGLTMALGAVSVALQAYGAYLLFRPDAVAWLEGKGAGGSGPSTFG